VADALDDSVRAFLGTAESTVKVHVSSILSKLGVRDRVQAVLRVLDAGLI
jgi:DNA-binding NarL/FixJ family response regulator